MKLLIMPQKKQNKWYLFRKVEFWPLDTFIVSDGYVNGKNSAFDWRFANMFFYFADGYICSFRSVKDIKHLTKILDKKLDLKFVRRVGKEIRSSADRLLQVTKKTFRNKNSLRRHFEEFYEAYKSMAAVFQTPEYAQYFLKNKDRGLLYRFGLDRDYAARILAKTEKIYRPHLKRILRLPRALYLLPDEVRAFLETAKLPKDLARRKTCAIIIRNQKTRVLWNSPADRLFKQEYLRVMREVSASRLSGQVAYKGKVKGKAFVALNEKQFKAIPQDAILICSMTRYTVVPYLKRVKAIVTDQGGITCHAAIMARELKVPALIGTKNATDVFKTGDTVEMDANKGVIRKI